MGKDKGKGEWADKAARAAGKAESKKDEMVNKSCEAKDKAADTTLGEIGHKVKKGAQAAYEKTAEMAKKAKDKLTNKDD